MAKVGYKMVLTAGGQTVGKARDVELQAQGAEVDVSTRDGAGWKEFVQGLKEWGVTVDQLWVATNTGLRTLRDAFLAGTEIAVSLLDDDGNGFIGQAIVTSMNRGEPLGDAVVLPVTLKGTGALSVAGPAS